MAQRVCFTFWDGGMAHFGRTLGLCEVFCAAGFEVGFITSQKFFPHLRKLSYQKTIALIENRKHRVHAPPYPFPVYSHAYRHAQRLVGLEFDDVEFLTRTVQAELGFIRQFQPSLIINDYRDTIRIAAEVAKVPLIGVTTTNGNSHGLEMGWWSPPPEDLIMPDCRASFNSVRQAFGLMPIVDERENFEGEITVIPSIPQLDPLVRPGGKNIHVGMLHRPVPVETVAPVLRPLLDAGRPIIAVYFGERNHTAWDTDAMLVDVASMLPVGLAIAGAPEHYPAVYEAANRMTNLVAVPRWPAAEWAWLLTHAAALVTHGVTSALAAAAAGVPVVIIPWNTEAATAYSICSTGAGLWLPHSGLELDRRPAPDLGTGVEILGHWESQLSGVHLCHALERVIGEPHYRERAGSLASELAKFKGAEAVVEIAQTLLDG